MEKFFTALRSIAAEFTAVGYFKEKVPQPKSLWRWLKRFFTDYMTIKTKFVPKSASESMNDRLLLDKISRRLKCDK